MNQAHRRRSSPDSPIRLTKTSRPLLRFRAALPADIPKLLIPCHDFRFRRLQVEHCILIRAKMLRSTCIYDSVTLTCIRSRPDCESGRVVLLL